MFWCIGDGLTHTRDHWADRPQWRGGRRQLTFHLTFDGSGLAEATAALREGVAGLAAVDEVPPTWLHLTMTALGFTDEVDPDAAGAVAEDAFSGSGAGGDLSFDTLLVGAEGPLLCPRPAGWLDEAVRVQRDAVDRHLGGREWRDFWPHVSLGYANAAVPIGVVADALGPVAEATPPVTVRPAVALVEQTCVDHLYSWREIRRWPA